MIVADNDKSLTGERVAKATGLKYWMSDAVGEDFNDFQLRVGLFKSLQALKGF
jgi:putative DNA primase/helicase